MDNQKFAANERHLQQEEFFGAVGYRAVKAGKTLSNKRLSTLGRVFAPTLGELCSSDSYQNTIKNTGTELPSCCRPSMSK